MDDIEKKMAADLEAGKEWARSNGVTVERVKVCKFASHETVCFEAVLMQNGRKVGTAENDGNGGCSFVHVNKDLNPPPCLDAFVDDVVFKIDEEKRNAQFIARAKKNAQKKAVNLAIIKGPGLAYMQTTEPSAEAFKAKHPEYKAADIDFCIYRTAESEQAARIRTQADFLIKCEAKAKRLQVNMVIQWANGWVKSVHYIAKEKTLDFFRTARPALKGADLTLMEVK